MDVKRDARGRFVGAGTQRAMDASAAMASAGGGMVRVGGVRVVLDQAAIARLLDSPSGPVAKMLMRLGQKAEGIAKRLCPVDTNRLRSSITHRLAMFGTDLGVEIGTTVYYAKFVEFGTRFMGARPFLRPAVQEAVASASGGGR